MDLGAHIFKNGDALINLTTRYSLPITATHAELSSHFFLKGQEIDAIKEGLLLNKEHFVPAIHINVIPTWRCNLRCSHCFVSHKLKKSGDSQIDVDKFYGFIQKIRLKHPELSKVNIVFIGGEATLNPDLCLNFIAKSKEQDSSIKYHFDMTSNGLLLDDKILKLYSALDTFMISLDGTKQTHNNQRIPLDYIQDPYEVTRKNIQRLVLYGLRDKIKVQSSLPLSISNVDIAKAFYKDMLMAGVSLDKINFGFTSPNKRKPVVEPGFKDKMVNKIAYRPCCKYRMNSHYIVDDNNTIYADYFEDQASTYLGTLDDSIDDINRRHSDMISQKIPVLNDPKCMACPVVGVCWGWCANTHNFAIKPSEYCAQESIYHKFKTASDNNEIETLLLRGKTKTSDMFYSMDEKPSAF